MEATGSLRRSASAGTTHGGDAKALFAAIKRQSCSVLAGITSGYFEAIRIRSQDAWLASPHERQLQVDREAATSLEDRASRFAQDWRQRLETSFDQWLQASPVQTQERQALSLLSETQLQLQLQVQVIAGVIESRLDKALETVEARLSQLALAASGAKRGPAPVGPLAVGQSFIAGFQGEDLSEGLRKLLMSEFETRLTPVLTSLYEELDRQLTQAGFAARGVGLAHQSGGGASASASPASSARSSSAPASSSRPASAMPTGHTGAAAQAWVPDGGMVERREMASGASTGSAGSSQVATAGSEPGGHALGARILPPAIGAAAAPLHESASSGAQAIAAAASAEGVPMRYRDIVHDHLRHWRESTKQPAANEAEPARAALGSEALHTVASLLQGDDPSTFAQVMARDGGRSLSLAIRDAVASGARQLGLSGGTLQFAPDQEDAIDLVAMLFEALMHTRKSSAATTPRLYAQLVMPYLKIALLDDSLFNRRTHPARQLLDTLTDICDDAAAEGDGSAMAEGVVHRIVSGYREDLAIFELAVDELKQFQQQNQRRAELAERRTAEAVHGRERLVHARAATRMQLLSWARRQLELTEAVAGFLQGPWRHAHEQACLRQAEEPDRAEQLVLLGEALLRLDAIARQVDGATVAGAWLGVAEAVETCCLRAGMDDTARRDLVAGLIFALAHPGTPRSQRMLVPEPDAIKDAEPEDAPALRLAGGTTGIPHDPALAARMRRLRAGQPLRIIDEHGAETAGRVAWVSPLTARLLIVNRRGQRQLVASPEEVAALLQAGRIALSASEAPFDRAMKRLWQQLNAAKGEEASAG